jgi:hypothetical protein
MRHVITRHSLFSALCVFAASILGHAADQHPDFSGEWKMNPAKSVLGPIPAPASLVRRFVHADPSLTITEEQKGGSGDHVSTRRYTTDGREVTFQEDGSTVVATAAWEGDALLIRSKADVGGTTFVFVQKMTLSDGGKTLTDALQIITPQGEINATYWFDKQ